MPRVLVLLAHHDDEFFLAPLIQDECHAGAELSVAFLTHGSVFGADAQTRVVESDRVLSLLGVDPARVFQLGAELGIFDRELMHKAAFAHAALARRFQSSDFQRVYLMGWEGGHPDHDAAHVIGASWARPGSAELLEFPLYNACGHQPGHYSSMTLTTRTGRMRSRPIDEAEARAWRELSACYASQQDVFAMLMPGIEHALFVRKSCEYRELEPLPDYALRPHAGPLLYEQRQDLSFETFREKLAGLRKA